MYFDRIIFIKIHIHEQSRVSGLCLGLTEAAIPCVAYSVLKRVSPLLTLPLKCLGPWCLKDSLDVGYFQDP